MSLFSGIGTALSSLQAQMQAMETTGHNIANVNTPGYRRQEVTFATRSPYPAVGNYLGPTGGQVGTGVEISQIRRAQDGYLGIHIRTASADLGKWQATQDALTEIQSVVVPSAGEDLGAVLDKFWDDWQTLSTHPSDDAARFQVRSQGIALAEGLRDLSQKLQWQAANVDVAVQGKVDEINSMTRQVAELNRTIAVASAEGRQPNDLKDQRDTLLQKLSTLTGATIINTETAQPMLNLGGRPLVQGELSYQLTTATGTSGHLEVRWADDNSLATVQTGELAGLLDIQTQSIPQYLNQLDAIASTLIAEVNALHQTGYGTNNSTGLNFFTPGATAADIQVDAAIKADVKNIATAAAADSPGDGSVATAIARLRSKAVLAGNQSLAIGWQSVLGQVGSDVKAAEDRTKASESIIDQLTQQQQSIAGVSLDEEMAKMTQYQHAYDAAARVLSTYDEMLDTIINRLTG